MPHLTPDNPSLRPLTVADLFWVIDMGFLHAVEPALVLRGLPEESEMPAADLETILDMPFGAIAPYYMLLEEQQAERGEWDTSEAGVHVYMLANPLPNLDSLRLRHPPRVRDLMGVQTGAAKGDVTAISRLSGVPMDDLLALALGDFMELQDRLMRFLSSSLAGV